MYDTSQMLKYRHACAIFDSAHDNRSATVRQHSRIINNNGTEKLRV